LELKKGSRRLLCWKDFRSSSSLLKFPYNQPLM